MPDFAVVTAFRATDKMSPAFNKMGAAADRFGNRAASSFGRASAASTAMMGAFRMLVPALGIAGILKFSNDSIEKWKEQETAVANMEAGLKSTNNAIGMTSRQLQGMASRWQDVGIFGDEEILQNVTAQLLTFGSIGKANFDKMQGAAQDITAKLYGMEASGEQLRDVTIMLGKAMDNPIRGMTALRRRGIQFTEQQENMIAVMQRTQGREAAQAYLLAEIEKLYGGVTVALRQTDAGMERAAKNKLADTMERVGAQLIPLKQTILDLAVTVLPILTDGLEITVKFLREMKVPLAIAVGLFVAYKVALMGIAVAQAIVTGIGWIRYLAQMLPLMRSVIAAHGLWNFLLGGNATAHGIATAAAWTHNTAVNALNATMVRAGVSAKALAGTLGVTAGVVGIAAGGAYGAYKLQEYATGDEAGKTEGGRTLQNILSIMGGGRAIVAPNAAREGRGEGSPTIIIQQQLNGVEEKGRDVKSSTGAPRVKVEKTGPNTFAFGMGAG